MAAYFYIHIASNVVAEGSVKEGGQQLALIDNFNGPSHFILTITVANNVYFQSQIAFDMLQGNGVYSLPYKGKMLYRSLRDGPIRGIFTITTILLPELNIRVEQEMQHRVMLVLNKHTFVGRAQRIESLDGVDRSYEWNSMCDYPFPGIVLKSDRDWHHHVDAYRDMCMLKVGKRRNNGSITTRTSMVEPEHDSNVYSNPVRALPIIIKSTRRRTSLKFYNAEPKIMADLVLRWHEWPIRETRTDHIIAHGVSVCLEYTHKGTHVEVHTITLKAHDYHTSLLFKGGLEPRSV